MKVYWEYMCDYGHQWTLYRDEDAVEQAEDTVCSFGHAAVVLHKSRPVDSVQITLKPAALMVDEVKNQIVWERHYWFIVSDIEGNEVHQSARPYLWRDALGLAEKFQGRSKASAWELWQKLSL
jgi:hypothetical protein